jgi:cytochrome c-type biogenesis protein CcmH/NrfF
MAFNRSAAHLHSSCYSLPCCWSEPVSQHRSEVSLRLRVEIANLVSAGKTDREILDHYMRIYGSRILIEPEGATRVWLYFIPAVVIAAGIMFVVWVIRNLLERRFASSDNHGL